MQSFWKLFSFKFGLVPNCFTFYLYVYIYLSWILLTGRFELECQHNWNVNSYFSRPLLFFAKKMHRNRNRIHKLGDLISRKILWFICNTLKLKYRVKISFILVQKTHNTSKSCWILPYFLTFCVCINILYEGSYIL